MHSHFRVLFSRKQIFIDKNITTVLLFQCLYISKFLSSESRDETKEKLLSDH